MPLQSFPDAHVPRKETAPTRYCFAETKCTLCNEPYFQNGPFIVRLVFTHSLLQHTQNIYLDPIFHFCKQTELVDTDGPTESEVITTQTRTMLAAVETFPRKLELACTTKLHHSVPTA
jgi:hypothetical protein